MFIQTMAYPKNIYSAKTLNDNWWESRCDPSFDDTNKLKHQSLLPSPLESRFKSTYSATVSQQPVAGHPFFTSTQNWMNFQPPKQLETTTGDTYRPIEEQRPPFKLRDTVLTGNSEKLDEYRKTWSEGNHQFPRTYQGALLQRVERREA